MISEHNSTLGQPTERSRVERYAAISARLRRSPTSERAGIIALCGLSEGEWASLSVEAAALLSYEIATGGHDLLLAYAEAYAAPQQPMTAASNALVLPEAPPPHVELATYQHRERAPEGFHAPMPISTQAQGAPNVLETPPPQAPVPAAVRVFRPPAALASTSDLDLQKILRPIVPFREGPSSPPSPSVPQPVRKPSGTMALPVAPQPSAQSIVPFRAGSSSEPPAPQGSSARVGAGPGLFELVLANLTLEQYCQLCVEMANQAVVPEPTLRRFHLSSPEAVRAVHSAWQDRLAAEPALLTRWRARCAELRGEGIKKE